MLDEGKTCCRPKIHQTYRYGYIKDVILPRTMDDATFATISSLMLFNNVEVPLPAFLTRAPTTAHMTAAASRQLA